MQHTLLHCRPKPSDGVQVDALSIARSHPMCYSRRNPKGPILLCDFGLPSMSTEGESALVRFCYRTAPPLCPAQPSAVPTISSQSPATLLTLLPATTLGEYNFKLSLPGCTRD
jgi:hypothetical protein